MSTVAYQSEGIDCPCCGRKSKASVFRTQGHKYPIAFCPHKSCILNNDLETQKGKGREYAEDNPHIAGIIGQGVYLAPKPQYRRSRAAHLAAKAHHIAEVRCKNAAGLIRWFEKKCKQTTPREILEFLQEFRSFHRPTMDMDEVFTEAANLFISGKSIAGSDAPERCRIVAAVAYVMSLYRGTNRLSFSSRLIEQHFKVLGLGIIGNWSVNKAKNELIQSGLLRLAKQHERLNREGEFTYRAPVYEFLGSRPFDDLDSAIADLSFKIGLNSPVREVSDPELSHPKPVDSLSTSVAAVTHVSALDAQPLTTNLILENTLSMCGQASEQKKSPRAADNGLLFEVPAECYWDH